MWTASRVCRLRHGLLQPSAPLLSLFSSSSSAAAANASKPGVVPSKSSYNDPNKNKNSKGSLFTSKRNMSVLLECEPEEEKRETTRSVKNSAEEAASWLLRKTQHKSTTNISGENPTSTLRNRFSSSSSPASSSFSFFGKAKTNSTQKENVLEQAEKVEEEQEVQNVCQDKVKEDVTTTATATATNTAVVKYDIPTIEHLLREGCSAWIEDCLVIEVTEAGSNDNNNTSVYTRALVQLRSEAPSKHPIRAAQQILQSYTQHYHGQQQGKEEQMVLPSTLQLTAGVRVVATLPRCHRGLVDRQRAVEEEMELITVQGI